MTRARTSREEEAVQYIAMCCAVLYCTVLYCTVLYCTVRCCNVLCCTVLFCVVLYCTVLYCTVLYCTVLCCAVLYRAVTCQRHRRRRRGSRHQEARDRAGNATTGGRNRRTRKAARKGARVWTASVRVQDRLLEALLLLARPRLALPLEAVAVHLRRARTGEAEPRAAAVVDRGIRRRRHQHIQPATTFDGLGDLYIPVGEDVEKSASRSRAHRDVRGDSTSAPRPPRHQQLGSQTHRAMRSVAGWATAAYARDETVTIDPGVSHGAS